MPHLLGPELDAELGRQVLSPKPHSEGELVAALIEHGGKVPRVEFTSGDLDGQSQQI